MAEIKFEKQPQISIRECKPYLDLEAEGEDELRLGFDSDGDLRVAYGANRIYVYRRLLGDLYNLLTYAKEQGHF